MNKIQIVYPFCSKRVVVQKRADSSSTIRYKQVSASLAEAFYVFIFDTFCI